MSMVISEEDIALARLTAVPLEAINPRCLYRFVAGVTAILTRPDTDVFRVKRSDVDGTTLHEFGDCDAAARYIRDFC